MNAGEMTQYFIDSNIWLYRFIVNTNNANLIKKQQIANPENPKIGGNPDSDNFTS